MSKETLFISEKGFLGTRADFKKALKATDAEISALVKHGGLVPVLAKGTKR